MQIITQCDDDSLQSEALIYAYRSIQCWRDGPIWCDESLIRFAHHETDILDVVTSIRRTKTGYSVRVWSAPAMPITDD